MELFCFLFKRKKTFDQEDYLHLLFGIHEYVHKPLPSRFSALHHAMQGAGHGMLTGVSSEGGADPGCRHPRDGHRHAGPHARGAGPDLTGWPRHGLQEHQCDGATEL